MTDFYTLVDVLQRDAKFSTITKAIVDAGLVETLKASGPFTIFAPTNNAFAKLPAEIMSDLMKPENKTNLGELLKIHVIEGKIMAADIVKLTTAKTIQGQIVSIDATDGIKINGAKLQARNVEASNGFIHALDTVLTLSNTAKIV